MPVRGILGAVGSQSFSGCEGCEVTKGNDVMAACLTPVNAWRELMEKKDNNVNQDSFQKILLLVIGFLFSDLFLNYFKS